MGQRPFPRRWLRGTAAWVAGAAAVLARAALPLWRDLEEQAGTSLLETTGGIDHGDPSTVGTVAAALEAAPFIAWPCNLTARIGD